MTTMFPKNELNHYSRDELDQIRKKKLKMAIISAKRILQKGKVLEIADKFIHETIKLMENGIIKRNPNLTQKEIQVG